MTIHAHFAFFAVGGTLLLLGLVLLLAVPGAAVLVLLLGVLHVTVGVILRGRTRRREAEGSQSR
jgi:Flp pilus assembly protein TadB